jgi:hypothetical protein
MSGRAGVIQDGPFHLAALDQIMLTIDGQTLGPFTRAQLQARSHFHLE